MLKDVCLLALQLTSYKSNFHLFRHAKNFTSFQINSRMTLLLSYVW